MISKSNFFGKFIVAGIMGRNCHNGAGSLCRQYIIGDPDRFLAIDWIDCISACEYAGLFFCKLCTVQIAFQ